jgi:deazaflavin-dependent oxidoreductase (nitroreductase family)
MSVKIPEPLFKIINLIVGLLLVSPVHGFWSKSLLVIGFKGRKTGRSYETPVRYVETGEVIQCFTSKSGKWWRNVAATDRVTLLVRGVESTYQSQLIIDDAERIGAALQRCLSLYPQDAAYHDITMGSDGNPNSDEFENALSNVVLIELIKIKKEI